MISWICCLLLVPSGYVPRPVPKKCCTDFTVAPKGEETVLVHFYNKHGQFPQAPLLLGENGELYGTTTEGGKFKQGVAFKVKK